VSQRDSALAEIRRARPEAPPALRQRVQLIARLEPAPPRRAVTRRRLVFVLAAGVLAAGLVAGVMSRDPEVNRAGGAEAESARTLGPMSAEDTTASALPTPPIGRIQDYRAELGVRVDDLPRATQQAMQIAQSLGGFVVSAQYDGGASDSFLVLSVPVARTQDAIDRLSRLGELTTQRFSLQDLQSTVDQLDTQADRLQARIASLERQLRNPALTPGERTALRARLDQTQRELEEVLAQREGTAQQGRMAEITLTLTSQPEEESPASGVIDRAVDALASVWTWVLAILIVGAPFAVLLVAAFLLGRRLRRRANERLLGS
jgi:outer membrane murein-binding lipoprotein Lpp